MSLLAHMLLNALPRKTNSLAYARDAALLIENDPDLLHDIYEAPNGKCFSHLELAFQTGSSVVLKALDAVKEHYTINKDKEFPPFHFPFIWPKALMAKAIVLWQGYHRPPYYYTTGYEKDTILRVLTDYAFTPAQHDALLPSAMTMLEGQKLRFDNVTTIAHWCLRKNTLPTATRARLHAILRTTILREPEIFTYLWRDLLIANSYRKAVLWLFSLYPEVLTNDVLLECDHNRENSPTHVLNHLKSGHERFRLATFLQTTPVATADFALLETMLYDLYPTLNPRHLTP